MDNEAREKLRQIRDAYAEYVILQQKKHETLAKMLRACVRELKDPFSKKRGEALRSLLAVAEMLEKKDS